jgi:phage anti-repressor protein
LISRLESEPKRSPLISEIAVSRRELLSRLSRSQKSRSLSHSERQKKKFLSENKIYSIAVITASTTEGQTTPHDHKLSMKDLLSAEMTLRDDLFACAGKNKIFSQETSFLLSVKRKNVSNFRAK